MLLDVPTLLLASYIFSWQFPHFYGILYENQQDYKKAGFVMISDEDPTGQFKAYDQMWYCNAFNTVLPVAMALPQVGLIHPALLVPFMYYQSKTFTALTQFKNEKASPASAKQVKKTAYMPFLILLIGFFGTTFYNRYEERRIQD
jgi:heme O synthase-like polyprenyltransferase